MSLKIFISIVLVLFLLVSSCKKDSSVLGNHTAAQDTIENPQEKIISSIGVSLNPKTKKALNNWEEYQLVDEMLTRFYAISNAEALSNATELSKLTKLLKDSIRDSRLETPSVKARLNLLYSESKRLEDMNTIPAIKQEEVALEIKKILEAFSTVKAKFNSVLAINELENELDLDPDFQAMINNSDDSIEPFEKFKEKKPINNPINKLPEKESPLLNKKKNKKKISSFKDLQTKNKLERDEKLHKKAIDKENLHKKREAIKREAAKKRPRTEK